MVGNAHAALTHPTTRERYSAFFTGVNSKSAKS
jgi:hypothetical protein